MGSTIEADVGVNPTKVDGRHAGLVDAKEAGDFVLVESGVQEQVLDDQHLLAGQLPGPVPELSGHVPEVVGLGAKEQVVRTGAYGIVASVENGEAVRNGAEVKLPRHAMRLLRSAEPAAYADSPVAMHRLGPGPAPTTIGAIREDDHGEKPVSKWLPDVAKWNGHSHLHTQASDMVSP